MKAKLPLRKLITNRKLAELQNVYRNPYMTGQQAYQKVIRTNTYVEAMKALSAKYQ